jgi:hypothetical protein
MRERPSTVPLLHRRPLAGRMALVILVAVCSVAAHQATYLLGFGGDGFSEAKGVGGHDGYWAPLVVLVLLAAAILSLVTLRQLRRLAVHAGHRDGASHPDRELRAFMGDIATNWLRLGLATAIVYAIQENVERVLVGLAPTDLDALVGHGPLPAIVVLLSSLAVAAVAALVHWRCEVLLARLASRTPQPRRPTPMSARVPRSARAPRAAAPAARGSRAPPVVALTV